MGGFVGWGVLHIGVEPPGRVSLGVIYPGLKLNVSSIDEE
jgi:hypothetical protein